MANFEALTFFLGPDLFVVHDRLSCVDVVPGSMLHSAISVSFASCLEDVSWPSSAYAVAASVVCAATSGAFFCSTAFCVISRTALTSAVAFSFRLLSASWVIRNLASFLCFYAAAFSSSAKSGAHHTRGHVSKTVNIVSSMATNGSFVHCCVGSFHALM